MTIQWGAELNTGIPVIDKQHMRIVDFINELEEAQANKDKQKVKQVVDDCVDYTLSHFAFEESLMEEAGYPYFKPHKKVHDLFVRKVSEFQERLALGDDVADELHGMLARWLVNHIKRDDADYISSVKGSMIEVIKEKEKEPENKKEGGWFRRFFK